MYKNNHTPTISLLLPNKKVTRTNMKLVHPLLVLLFALVVAEGRKQSRRVTENVSVFFVKHQDSRSCCKHPSIVAFVQLCLNGNNDLTFAHLFFLGR
jgi:hypothetical protein